MKLARLHASSYKSLCELELPLASLNVLIGANAAGKSNILDALRFLADSMKEREFTDVVAARGGIIHLAWKGETASEVTLRTTFADAEREVTWNVTLERKGTGYTFRVRETVYEERPGRPPNQLLDCKDGSGWWWSGEGRKVPLKLAPTACAFAAAAADASFPAGNVAEFVQGWGFYDPSPALLRRASNSENATRLEAFGRNLAARLYTLRQQNPGAFERIVSATRSVLGVPEAIDFRVSEQQDSVYFTQTEEGLEFRVHQVGASSGTLRMLALMTGLFGEERAGLIGIEEPENQIHPAALGAFAEHLRAASERVQVVVTTHSPLLLNYLDVPEAICVVRRTANGTEATRESNPEGVRDALERSGFGLGEFHETKGFGV
jgi:predicted ATPase